MPVDTTILIPAWNAAAYIERALASIGGPAKIILVDDWSSDNTALIAQKASPYPITVLQPPRKQSLGLVRQTALEAVQTPFAIWLDADDEYLPGRLERMLKPLREGVADFATDGQELVDGRSGAFIRDLPIPSFLQEDRNKVRLFERNWLPGIAHIAFRTSVGKKIGYDSELHGGDDSDFVWRAIRAEARFHFIHEKGYRMYAYDGSDSRKLDKQRAMVKRALLKHEYNDIIALYLNAGYSKRVAAWGVYSMALFREEYPAASQFLELAFPHGSDPDEILEPDGPYPTPERWRYLFAKGTLSLLQSDPKGAFDNLNQAMAIMESPELMNNLGIAFWHRNEPLKAKNLFRKSIEKFSGFLDAKNNLESSHPSSITSHPLRLQPSRCEY